MKSDPRDPFVTVQLRHGDDEHELQLTRLEAAQIAAQLWWALRTQHSVFITVLSLLLWLGLLVSAFVAALLHDDYARGTWLLVLSVLLGASLRSEASPRP